jgi:uncharacterized membrane protein YbhN (UPF0104 family)
MRRTTKEPEGKVALKALGVVLGVVLSAVLLLTPFFRFNLKGDGPLLSARFTLGSFLAELPANLPWLIPFALLSGAVIPLRAFQWQATLQNRVPFKERYHLVAIGAFAHNALPGKFGDILRAFLLSRTQGLAFPVALGSVAVCKLLEFAALMLLVALSFLGPFGDTMARFSSGLKVAVGVCLGLVVVVVLLARYASALSAALERRGRFHKAQVFLHHVADGLGTARSLRGMLRALVYSIPPVLAPATAYGLGLSAIGVEGGLFAGIVVLGAIAMGQATPGLPAGTGIYYFVTSWAARNLGASPEDAAAYAMLTHLGTILTQIAVGGVSVWVRKIRWRDLRRSGQVAKETARQELEEASAQPQHA